MSTDTPRTEGFVKSLEADGKTIFEALDEIQIFARQLERELAAEQEKCKGLREALELSLRYGMTKNDLADAHLLDKNAPLRIVSATLEATK